MKLLKRTAVVVSAHRPYATIELCLQGFRSIVEREEDLIFVNNGSSPSLDRLVSEKFRGITLVNMDENRLFCAGYNAGIRTALAANYDFILIANADTEVANPDFINELLSAADRWPKAAFLGPLVYYRDRNTTQNTRFSFPSVMRNVTTWIPWRILPALRRRHRLQETQVDYLNGVCVLCRSSALREFGLMDEDYGGYVEDADWSWRAMKSGWISVFIPVPGIIHHEEQQGYGHSSFKSFLLKRNTVLWYLKAGYKFSAFLYALASLCLAALRLLRSGSSSTGKEHRQFCKNLNRSYRSMLFGSSSHQSPKPAISAEKGRLEIWQ
ncbi:MAG: glycosyltransferase family 2 protein [Acidobacteria bacterium]|nr:glycosyltransferase family 2 protein [Acidobacteriota bacterium]